MFKNVLRVALFLFIGIQARADFARDFFIRHELVRQGILSKPPTFKAGEEYTYTNCCIGQKTIIVKITDTIGHQIHYVETRMESNKVDKYEGWLNNDSGQLDRFIENGQEYKTQPQEEIIIRSVKSISNVKTPVGIFDAVAVVPDSGSLVEEWVLSEQVSGTGMISSYRRFVTSSSQNKWISYSP